MTGRNSSKEKGDRAELEAARLLADLTGWPVRRRLGAGRADDTGDLDGIPDTCIQVKNYRDITRAVGECLNELPQQQANAKAPFAAGLVRRPGGRWFAVMNVEQLAALLREATRPEGGVGGGRALGRGHDMRHIWQDEHGWWVLCECGHETYGPYQHEAIDAWHAHRDEEGL